ncbi:MAG: hypothetical protein KKF89_01610 [Nanoarchaeota archaeon]|nr:hypothetical protein [Nanoarchaeota archaeon]MBU1854393.1 hypothetical protein [Nanoarchaeota archaeon]
MDETTLKEWIINFVKNKDLMYRKLVSYEEAEKTVLFHFKDKDQAYFILPQLNQSIFLLIKEDGQKTIVCLASRDNLKFLIDNWSSFSVVNDLNFVFVSVQTNKRWIINPGVHSKICDDDSLVFGLESMYSATFES